MGYGKLFPGSSHYNRYTNVISELIKDNADCLASYDRVENLVLHSVQKWVEMFLWSGRSFGLTIIEKFLRVGWKTSEANERYLKYDTYGYQYCSTKLTDNSEITIGFLFCLISLR